MKGVDTSTGPRRSRRYMLSLYALLYTKLRTWKPITNKVFRVSIGNGPTKQESRKKNIQILTRKY